MNNVNVVNVGERYKEVTFTTYPPENKGPVNVVNVVRRFFVGRRTLHAKGEMALKHYTSHRSAAARREVSGSPVGTNS